MIKIQIPATSANLGAGFDALGLALTYYNYIEMEECDKIDITAADREAGVEIKPLKELLPHIPSHINAAINHALQKKWQTRTTGLRPIS